MLHSIFDLMLGKMFCLFGVYSQSFLESQSNSLKNRTTAKGKANRHKKKNLKGCPV